MDARPGSHPDLRRAKETKVSVGSSSRERCRVDRGDLVSGETGSPLRMQDSDATDLAR